jgi:hypothetical protein
MENKQKVSVGMIKFQRIHRKIHFIFFNTALLDIMFKGSRNILHSSVEKSAIYWLIAVIAVSLAMYDVVEISLTSIKVIYNISKFAKSAQNNKTDEQKSTKNVEKQIPQSMESFSMPLKKSGHFDNKLSPEKPEIK